MATTFKPLIAADAGLPGFVAEGGSVIWVCAPKV